MPELSDRNEERRNRLLRRADWRFLLPNPEPEVSLCLTGGLLRQAVKLVSRQVHGVEGWQPGGCDLVVAANPNRAGLQAAREALRPGGALYTEWCSPPASSLAGVRRRLEGAGFTDISLYWAWSPPNWGSPIFWLPLEKPEALKYYLDCRPRPRTMLSRLQRAALYALWRSALRAGVLLPICVTARKEDPLESALAEPSNEDSRNRAGQHVDLLSFVRENWSSWGLGDQPQRLSWMLYTPGQSQLNKVIGLVFPDGESQPVMAVKMPRVPESTRSLAAEAEVLERIGSQENGRVKGIPKILFRYGKDHLRAVGETALAGAPLYTVLDRGNFRDLALKVTDWLSELAGQSAPVPPASWWARIVEPAVEEFERAYGPALNPGETGQVRRLVSQLPGLPIVCEQRDCSPWNLLVSASGELVVLDWESAEHQGLPLLDLVYFLAYLAFFLDGAMDSGSFRESYRRVLNGSSLTGRVTAECIQRYCEYTGIDLESLRPLRLLTWLIHSRSEYQRMAADFAGRPETAALQRSLFFVLVLEELREWNQT